MPRLLTRSNLLTLSLVLGAAVMWGAAGVKTATTPSSSNEIDLVAAPTLGAGVPELDIVYFYRYDCPHCAGVSASLERLVANRTDVAVHYAQLPVDRTETAPVAAACAEEAGAFEAYHERARQGLLDPNAVPEGCDLPAAQRRVERDYETADDLGVDVVPTLFIGRNRVNGAVDGTALDSLVAVALR